MLARVTDYMASISAGGVGGLLVGALCKDPWGGAVVGAVVGVFVGAAVRAWRTRDTAESFENRSLGD